jgi:hypothetical protein
MRRPREERQRDTRNCKRPAPVCVGSACGFLEVEEAFALGADDPTSKTFHVDEGYTEGWLRLAGADGFP